MTTTTEQTSNTEISAALACAIDRTDAVEALDGYAYYAEESGSWWTTSASDLEELGEMLIEGTPDAYSLWCAGSTAREVSDLDHDALDEIREAGGEPEYRCQCGAASMEACPWTTRRVSEIVHVKWVPESDRGSAKASGTYDRGAYARSLYVSAECAKDLAHTWEDGERTAETDPYVRIVGPAYEE